MISASQAPSVVPKLSLPNEPRERLIGTWKMVSWSIEDLISGEKSPGLGENPAGYITYSAEGRVMVLILRADRKKPAGLVPTDAEKVALYDGMFAYSGTYLVDEERVLHHIDMSWNEAWTGTTQIRFLSLKGDELTYISAPARNPINGRDCVHTVILRRAA
jgi:hypothetical protein